MINYIFEIVAFCISIVMYCKGDIKSMAIWLAAAVMLGYAGAIVDIFYSRKRNKEEHHG